MEMKLSSIYTIDRQHNIAVKNIPDEDSNFANYFDEVLQKIAKDEVVKRFLPKSDSTQVINLINEIIESTLDEEHDLIESHFEEVAKRLLEKEKLAQKKIDKLGREVQIGSLMQALFYDKREESYLYLLAKVGHTAFINQKGLASATGFPKEIKVYKSCVFYLGKDRNIVVKVHLDTVSKYWYDDFLELRELTTDESNTETAFNAVDGYLNRFIKKKYPEDRASLRNSFIHYFRQTTVMNYNDMINQIFDNYVPISQEFSKDGFKDAFLALPDKKGFERNFNVVPEIIKARIRTSYNIYPGITMKVTENREVINSIEENGRKYLKIEVMDETTFNEFKYKQ